MSFVWFYCFIIKLTNVGVLDTFRMVCPVNVEGVLCLQIRFLTFNDMIVEGCCCLK